MTVGLSACTAPASVGVGSLPLAPVADASRSGDVAPTLPAPAAVQTAPAVAAAAAKPRLRREPPIQGTDGAVLPASSVTGRGLYRVGPPYTVGGRTFVPAEDATYDAMGQASFYGEAFHGKPTANGEIFDMNGLSAAHPTLPMPCYVLVTNLRNGRTIMVRVNNRGPYTPGRILDLSRRAADLLDFTRNGVTQVRVRYAGPAPLGGPDDKPRQYLLAQPWWRGERTPRTAEVVPR